MSQEISRLVSALRIAVAPRHKQFKNPDGPKGRLNKMRSTVTALIKYERIELLYPRADEARGYAERVSNN
jgi:large subunit ribosomal protein L17